ncbi:MAG: magnesium transporter [Rickettsiaceae bacterium]
MHNIQHSISTDHQEKLDQQFEHITYLIDNDKLDSAIELLLGLHYADLADFLDHTSHKDYQVILPAIGSKIDANVLFCLNDGNKQAAIEALGIKASAKLISNLDIEDSIEVIEALNIDSKELLIAELPIDKKQQIIEGFRYPEDTAGRILEKDFVSLDQHCTVEQALDFIKHKNEITDFHAIILVNNRFKPVGTMLLSTLIRSNKDAILSELMNREIMVADTSTEINELTFLFKQYALTLVPVVNKQGKLVGSISMDSMLYLIDEQTEAEFLHLGGVSNSDIFYNLYFTAKGRFPWLFVNLVTACLTSLIINQFNETITQLVTLATIMPIVASMGGNAGTQVMTVTVRAIANREINNASTIRVITKEIYVCALNGLILALIGILLTYLLFSSIGLSMVFASAVIINFSVAGFLGSFIPIILNRLDIDPAAASGVFLTACTDSIGFLSFLGLAYFFLV